MTDEPLFKVGDVLRYTRGRGGGTYATPEVWVLVTSINPSFGEVLRGSFASISEYDATIGGPDQRWKGRDMIPQEEWPDWLCALMAKRALLGDAS